MIKKIKPDLFWLLFWYWKGNSIFFYIEVCLQVVESITAQVNKVALSLWGLQGKLYVIW